MKERDQLGDVDVGGRKDIIKMDHKRIECEDLHWIYLALKNIQCDH
jgi:hypothetical protein